MAKGNLAVGAALGAVIGFVSGILLAPKSGKETRDDLKNAALTTKDTVVTEANKVKDAGIRKANELRNKAEDVAGDLGEKANEIKGRAEQAIEGAKKGYAKNPTSSNDNKSNSKK